MNIWLIIGAVVAYLLIGAVVAGWMTRYDFKKENRTKIEDKDISRIFHYIFLWGILLPAAVVVWITAKIAGITGIEEEK